LAVIVFYRSLAGWNDSESHSNHVVIIVIVVWTLLFFYI